MAALPTTGITTSMVASAIGAATNDVGRLCTHPNINKWAKYKPVAIERVSGSNSGELAIPRYGLKVPTFPSLQLALEHYITYDGAVWEYIRPLSKPQYPARLGDFRKYEHNAERFYDFEFDDYVEEFYPIAFFSINLKLKQEDELSVSALDMRLNNKYFGVLVAKDNVPTISAYAITDNEIDIDSETEFTTSLIIPMAQMTAGEYVMCPFMANSNIVENITEVELFDTQELKFTYASGVEVTVWFIRYLGDSFAKFHLEFKNITNKPISLGTVRVELRYQDSHWTDPLINPPYEEFEASWLPDIIQPNQTITIEPDEPDMWLYDTYTHGENGLLRLFVSKKPSLNTYYHLENKEGDSPSDWWS